MEIAVPLRADSRASALSQAAQAKGTDVGLVVGRAVLGVGVAVFYTARPMLGIRDAATLAPPARSEP